MPATNLEAVLETVGLFYEAALDSQASVKALDSLRSVFASSAAQVVTFDRASGRVLEAHTDSDPANQAANEAYVAGWGVHDPRPPWQAAQPSGSVFRCHENFDEKFVAGNMYYQEFFIPSGYRWAIAGMVHHADGTTTALAALRSPDAPKYESSCAAVLSSMLPHVARAAALRERLLLTAGGRLELVRLIGSLPTAAAVTDAFGTVLHTNAAAILAMQDIPLRVVGSKLRFPASDSQAAWQRTMDQVRHTTLAASMQLNQGSQGSWTLHVVPWSCIGQVQDAADAGLRLVFFDRRGGPGHRQIAEFAARFTLSQAETVILEELLLGKRPKQIAQQRGSSLNTVRTQIKSVLGKTGAHTVQQLLSILQT